MSILNVEHLTHGFGDRAIFEDVSFRLLKGEHIGLVGANGEGKSTFMSIVTGKLMPDEGKVEWAKNVDAGYLDQHAVLEKGMTIGQVLKSAFDPLLKKEERMNEICDKLGTADPDEMDGLMEELGTIQDELTLHDFYAIDAKVEEVARALGLLDLGLDRDVTDLSGGQRTKVLLAKLLLEKPDILLLDEPTNYLDEEHIAWLKRYLLDYENAFILISHDIPFLNSVVNIIYHMENQELNRYVGDYDHFQEVYAVKKAQLEAAYRKQQQEISELKDFVARNKARVSTRNMAMSRQKKLDKMDVIDAGSVYLGRPWRDYAKTILISCELGAHIHPAGFHDWNRENTHDTVYYAEYASFPATSDYRPLSDRADFVQNLNEQQAGYFAKELVLGDWAPDKL